MKKVIFLISMTCLLNYPTFAQKPAGEYGEGLPITCFKSKKPATQGLTTVEIVELCAGAINLEPHQCYSSATFNFNLNKVSAISLCSGSVNSSGTLACYKKAVRDYNLTPELAIKLCQER